MFGTIFPVNDLILDNRNRKQLELLIFFHFSYLKKKYKLAALKVAQAEALLEMLVMRRETVGGTCYLYLYSLPCRQYERRCGIGSGFLHGCDSAEPVLPRNRMV